VKTESGALLPSAFSMFTCWWQCWSWYVHCSFWHVCSG